TPDQEHSPTMLPAVKAVAPKVRPASPPRPRKRPQRVVGAPVRSAQPPASAINANLDLTNFGPQPPASPSLAPSELTVSGRQINAIPFSRPGEALEIVPGLIVTQHSGEGKANQYFLRGFNLDHGTDIAITLDGMSINMRTHAHGQGYADPNFLIPELI